MYYICTSLNIYNTYNMDKIDLGEIKTTKRIRNGVEQVIRLFNKTQRQLIRDAVESKPDDLTIEDVLNLYKVSPPVYYSWIRNESKEKQGEEDELPNLLEESIDTEFASASQLRAFYEAKSLELKEFIEKKFREWEDSDIISQIGKKINGENMSEVAKAGGISKEELKSFLQRDNMNLSFYSVEAIKRYLQI
jgi:hypothetical protein